MLRSEFVFLMGIEDSELTETIYKEVEQLYMESRDESKVEFCERAKREALLFKLSITEAQLQLAELKAKIKTSPSGTNMSQEDYERLETAAKALVGHCDVSSLLTDSEAAMLVNSEFGFEASRIVILHEAEIVISEPGAQYLKFEKVPRMPLYDSTDWNYVRFNVRACACEWYFEMVNGDLRPVLI